MVAKNKIFYQDFLDHLINSLLEKAVIKTKNKSTYIKTKMGRIILIKKAIKKLISHFPHKVISNKQAMKLVINHKIYKKQFHEKK